jgi:RNA polymerase sigma-70 factor (ECF subfamily)
MAGERVLRLIRGGPREPDALAELARAAASGDRRAISTFIVTIAPHILRVVRRVMGASHPDADDISQEATVAIMHALPGHRGESTVLHFACRIAVLTAMNARRHEAAKKRASKDTSFPIELVPAVSPAPDDEAMAQARMQVLRDLLDTLPIAQAEVFAMHCVLGYTVREIADAVSVPAETVRSRMRLAKQALRQRVLNDPELEALLEEGS